MQDWPLLAKIFQPNLHRFEIFNLELVLPLLSDSMPLSLHAGDLGCAAQIVCLGTASAASPESDTELFQDVKRKALEDEKRQITRMNI